MLRYSSIFVFDEPTSHLDAATEATVMKVIKERTQGKTTIVVAHRLRTIRTAQSICFFGKLNQDPACKTSTSLEIGTHAELMEKDGKYAADYKLIYS